MICDIIVLIDGDEDVLMNEKIIATVRRLEKNYGAVYPYQVAIWMDTPLCERQVRKRMVRLAQAGALARLGERKGYMTKTRYEARFFICAVIVQMGGL